jgi:hypothetical protein
MEGESTELQWVEGGGAGVSSTKGQEAREGLLMSDHDRERQKTTAKRG